MGEEGNRSKQLLRCGSWSDDERRASEIWSSCGVADFWVAATRIGAIHSTGIKGRRNSVAGAREV